MGFEYFKNHFSEEQNKKEEHNDAFFDEQDRKAKDFLRNLEKTDSNMEIIDHKAEPRESDAVVDDVNEMIPKFDDLLCYVAQEAEGKGISFKENPYLRCSIIKSIVMTAIEKLMKDKKIKLEENPWT